MNKVTIMGRLGSDPELKYTNGGQPVGSLSVATTDTWLDKAGVKQERTEWHKVTAWGKQAEVLGKYLQKGDQILLEGRIQTDKWEDKDGNTRYTTKIILDKFYFVGGKSKQEKAAPDGDFEQSFTDEEIPF